MGDIAAPASGPWFRGIDRHQGRTLLATNLGSRFDGFETYALVLTVGPAMRNMRRFIAFRGPLLAGTLIVKFGGYGYSAMIICCIYILGFAATFFLPEARGKSLPDIS